MSAQDAPLERSGDPAAQRFALVIGQSDYRGARLVTGTADAARFATALESAGFSVDSGADLEQQLIREKIGALIAKATQAGDAETILVYLGGRVAQLNGENLLLPVGAPLDRATDVELNGYRLTDLVKVLQLVPAKARIIVVDAAAPPEQLAGDKLFSPGLAIISAPNGFLIAFNQNPGRALLEPQPPTGFFLRAFLDTLQQPVASFGDFFALARQRVFEESQNREMPWEDDKLAEKTLAFFPPPAGAALPSITHSDGTEVKLASMAREEAFKSVIASDRIIDYQAYLIKFPEDEAVPTIQYNLAVRREAEIWLRTLLTDTPQAYWTYIKTYPDGGNVEVARQKLAALGANPTPPDSFDAIVYNDLPPPLPPQVEMIASSASMPADLMPPPPKLGLPPISPIVAAAVALPVAAAIGRQLPHATGAIVRPSWAAATRPATIGGGGNIGGMARPAASSSPQVNTTVRSPTSFQPITSSHYEPAMAPANPSRSGDPQPGGAASFKPLNPPAGSLGSSPGTSIPTNPSSQIRPAPITSNNPMVQTQRPVSPGPITGPSNGGNPNKPIEPRLPPSAGARSN
ncbi:caspase family protein, partial [Rhodoblastus sp.]|uniref:caspase family protein n=1 Tax=Rhodoblastus sp. TaxID=1962975 RepID=UPI003F99236A